MGDTENLGSSKQQGQPVHYTSLPGSMSSNPINLNLERDSGNLINLDREGEGGVLRKPYYFLEISSYFFFFLLFNTSPALPSCIHSVYSPQARLASLYSAED